MNPIVAANLSVVLLNLLLTAFFLVCIAASLPIYGDWLLLVVLALNLAVWLGVFSWMNA